MSRRQLPRVLAPPMPKIINKIASYTKQITEIGGGEGLWATALAAHSVEIWSFDIAPIDTLVAFGDHRRAAKYGEGWMLAVWPPEDQLILWIGIKEWPGIILVGQSVRWGDFRNALTDYDLIEEVDAPAGEKGHNVMLVYRRK